MTAVSDTRVLVFHANEFWSLDVPSTTWTQLEAAATGAWPSSQYRHAMAAVSDTRVILFQPTELDHGNGLTSSELFSVDLFDHTVRYTLLTDEIVLEDEAKEKFNNVQVLAALLSNECKNPCVLW